MHRPPALLGPLVLCVALMCAQGASAFTLLKSPATGEPLHWLVPDLDYSLDASLAAALDPDEAQDAIADAFAPWQGIPCQPLTVTDLGYGDCGGEFNGDDGANCIYWVDNEAEWSAADFGSNEVAVTSVHFNEKTGEIVDVDLALNGWGFGWSTTEACSPFLADARAVLTHEAGHFVGLDHSQDPTATMAKSSGPGECGKRTLVADDLAGFCALYEGRVLDGGVSEGAGGGCAGGGPSPADSAAWLVVALALACARGRRHAA